MKTNGNSIRIETNNESETVNPFLGVDCKSFEYALPPGQDRRACAVKNFYHRFFSLRRTSSGDWKPVETESFADTVYFTMPAWKTNGQAANDTALALSAAIRATDLYYAKNGNATKEQVGNFFNNQIK